MCAETVAETGENIQYTEIENNDLPEKKLIHKRFNFYKLFWLFMIASFAGVVIETFWCLITRRQYENRVGVILGPFNPVYGFGAVLITVCLQRMEKKRDLWIFIGSMILGGGFEYLCSLMQEIAFGTVSWEYSHTQLNLSGRVNLMYSLFWGVLGVIWIKDIYPFIYKMIDKIANKTGKIITIVLCVFMVFNMLLSAAAVSRGMQRRKDVAATTPVGHFLDEYFDDDYLKWVYPNMQIVKDAKQH